MDDMRCAFCGEPLNGRTGGKIYCGELCGIAGREREKGIERPMWRFLTADRYRCPACERTFRRSTELTKHMKNAHGMDSNGLLAEIDEVETDEAEEELVRHGGGWLNLLDGERLVVIAEGASGFCVSVHGLSQADVMELLRKVLLRMKAEALGHRCGDPLVCARMKEKI